MPTTVSHPSPSSPHLVVTDARTLTSGDLDLSVLQRFCRLQVYDYCGPALVERIRHAHIVITNKERLDAHTLSLLPDLRLIAVLATGTDNIDVAAAEQRGVVVSNVPGYSTASVAQHVFAMLLELLNRPFEHVQAARTGAWSHSGDFSYRLGPIDELSDKTLGIVGMGAIGQRVANIGAAFGMHVLAASHASKRARPPADVESTPLDELFARADVLSLHCPLTPQTRGLVDARRLALMKSNAIVINTARGGLVDELALAQALRRGTLRAAALDVLQAEPPPVDHPLLQLDNCLVTPHMAWASVTARGRLLAATVANVEAFLQGRPINVVR